MDVNNHIKSLSKGAREVLDQPLEERIRKCKEQVWIPYPRANEILEELVNLFDYPKKDRMPNLLITGGTNNGKTAILNRFYSMYPDHTTTTCNVIPIIHFSAPISPSQNALYEKILDFLRVPYGINDSASRKEAQVLSVLKNIETKVIVIDEFNDIYHGGVREQGKFLTAVKQLGTNLQIPIIAAGIPDVQRTLSVDAQTANRFETMALPKWKIDKDFARLVVSFEKTLPLKEPSNLHKREMIVKLHELCEGVLGELETILQKASIYALKNRKEHISVEMLDEISYHSPRSRRRQ